MTSPATFARDARAASSARDRLDAVSEAMAQVEAAQRAAIAALIELWPTSAWLAAGVRTPKQWLVAHTGASAGEADRLERIAVRCAAHPDLADAVVSGRLPLRRAELVGRVVTDERAPFLAASLDAILTLGTTTADDDAFRTALRYWADRVDEHVAPRHAPRHGITLAERLFGGGHIHGELAPVAFDTVCTALDAWLQPPDPVDAPYRRSLAERRADALDDLSHFGLTHRDGDVEVDPDDGHLADGIAECTFDGLTDDEDADDHDPPPAADDLVALRRRIQRSVARRRRRARRRTRARSGVTINAHVDVRTLVGDRAIDDFDGLVLHGDGWGLARAALDRYRCDSALVATLFAGRTQLLDANTATEQFSHGQRRAIAARDRTCRFPGCAAPPRRCDVHHVHERADGGPTSTANGVLLCRFHHRLVHEHGWRLERDEDERWMAVDPHDHRWSGRRSHDQVAA